MPDSGTSAITNTGRWDASITRCRTVSIFMRLCVSMPCRNAMLACKLEQAGKHVPKSEQVFLDLYLADTKSGKRLARLTKSVLNPEYEELRSAYSQSAFSPDGRAVATGSYDHTAAIWDATDAFGSGNARETEVAIRIDGEPARAKVRFGAGEPVVSIEGETAQDCELIDSSAGLLAIRRPRPERVVHSGTALANIGEGFSWIWSQPAARSVVISVWSFRAAAFSCPWAASASSWPPASSTRRCSPSWMAAATVPTPER